MGAYSELKRHFHAVGTFSEIVAMLHWDMETTMPEGAAEARSAQLALLERHVHELTRDERLPGWLERAGDESLDERDQANLHEMRRRWRHAAALPDELVEELSHARSKCGMLWRQARREDDFSIVAPWLERVVELTREQAQRKAAVLDVSPYDALLDAYDPGVRSAEIDVLFAELRQELPPILEGALEMQQERPRPLSLGDQAPPEAQRRVALRVMRELGFDFSRGRLDLSLHPFCGGIPDDVRITTRFERGDLFFGLLGVVHETGHALYEQGLPVAWRRQPVGVASSMTIHESQSLLYEMQVGCGRRFLRRLAPILREELGVDGPAWSPENLRAHAARVSPGLIRIKADEVTYPFHVIVRYELERKLIDGTLAVRDLPEAFRSGLQELLGVAAPSDADGVLQDIHWYEGLFGYFPTYTLGAMAAAQLFSAAVSEETIEQGLEAGNYQPLLAWLRRHVHQHASFYTTSELIEEATGRPLSTAAFVRHLRRRYLVD